MKIAHISLIWISALCFYSCQEAPQGPQQRLFPVRVTPVLERDTPIYLEVIGNVVASTTVQIKSQVSGKLIEALVTEGQEVQQDDLLFIIDKASFQANVDKARATLQKDEASLQFAKKKVERYAELVKKDYVATLSFEEFQTNVKTYEAQVAIDKAELQAAEILLNYCSIHSPLHGKASELQSYPGNLVSPTDTTPLIEIRQIAPIDVQFALAQQDFDKVRQFFGSNAIKFEVLAEATAPIAEGKVNFIDNHIDLGTGTIILKGSFPNTDKQLWPGQFVNVRLILKIEKNAILVPVAAIQQGQQGPFVYILKPDQTVELHVVKLGEQLEEHRVIYADLSSKDLVVTDGQLNLRQGAKVTVVELPQEGS
jgi:multidrug efflux system membrane fusion protein